MASHPHLLDFFDTTELILAKQIVFEVFIGNPLRYQSSSPTVIVLGGQPASGKSGLILRIQKENVSVDIKRPPFWLWRDAQS